MTNIAVYGIAKNEIQNVKAWVEQFKDADSITVVDTGSTDGTLEELRRLATERKGMIVHSISFNPFRFDSAKNVALSFVPQEADLCISVDFDERISETGIAELRNTSLNLNETGSIRLIFTVDEYGAPAITYPRESVHPRNGFFWRHPVHELLKSTSAERHSTVDLPIDVTHFQDVTKDRKFYMGLLELMLNESPDNPRSYQYIGRECYMSGDYFQAIQYLQQHMRIEPYGPFRAESARYIAFSYLKMADNLEGAHDEAESWFYRSIAEHTADRESYYSLAHVYKDCGEFDAALGLIDRASKLPIPKGSFIVNSEYYGFVYGMHLKAACQHEAGYVEEARATIRKILATFGETATVPNDLLKDIMTIFGVENDAEKDSESGAQEVYGDEQQATEDVSEGIPEVVPPVVASETRTESKESPTKGRKRKAK